MRNLSSQHVQALGLGAALLGAGGGGDPYIGQLMATQALNESGPILIVEPEEIPDEAVVVMTGMMGAPTVLVERPPGETGQIEAIEALSDHMGRTVTHVTCIEVGGMNSTLPVVAAARTGLPLVDADGMGRAFPELQMVTPTLRGITAAPMAIADDKGNIVIIEAGPNRETEDHARSMCIDMGASAFIALYPMTGTQVRQSMIPGTLGRAEQAGRAQIDARAVGDDPIQAVVNRLGGYRLFTGKIGSLQRKTAAGFARGEFTVEGTDQDSGSELVVRFQNENLVATRDDRVVVVVPDLISVVDAETGVPITIEGLRYGFRVEVLGIPCNQLWRSVEGLKLVGPRYFGYDFDYVPVEDLQ